MFGHWVATGQYTCVDAREIWRLATEADVAALPHANCLNCDGKGAIVGE